jgi:pimeloyl-ACP methyl ester carboxylesterase
MTRTAPTTRTLPVAVDGGVLEAELALPANPRGIVLFAHGSGSSPHGGRNLRAARRLHARSFGTLLFDPLTREEQRIDEQRTRGLRFDVPLLAERLRAVSRALACDAALPAWRAYFGAGTGGAAALVAAAADPATVGAIVAHGGRPDLAGDTLAGVRAPTLLIAGGNDIVVLRLNQWALRALKCTKSLAVVAGATPLFDERGALHGVCEHATEWFDRHCPAAPVEQSLSFFYGKQRSMR